MLIRSPVPDARWALLSLFWGTCRRPAARPCTRPHVDEPRGGVVVLTILSKAKEVSGTRSRRASSPGRSRAFWQNSLAGPVNEVTTVVVVVGTMSKRTRSRPWRRCPDPYQPHRTRGEAGSTCWRPRAPTSPYSDGTSPTVPDGAHSRRRWAGRTSSRDKLEVWLPCTEIHTRAGVPRGRSKRPIGIVRDAPQIQVASRPPGCRKWWGNGV